MFGDDIITISRDYRDCISKEFLIKNMTDEEAQQILEDSEIGLADVSKFSLTTEEITSATSQQLLASSCKTSNECVLKEEDINEADTGTTIKKTASCVSLAKLRTDGIITEATETNYFNEGNKVLQNGLVGGALGGAAGITLCYIAAGTVTAYSGGIAIPSFLACSAIGASIAGGAAVGGTLLWNNLPAEDPILKALEARDASGVGICTEKASVSYDIGGFLTKIGDVISITGKPAVDGVIVIIGGIFLVMILFNLTKKK